MESVLLVTLVHDEESWIEAFLDHHRAVGVERFLVYLDRCTDGTAERLAGHEDVTTVVWDRPDSCRWLSEFQELVLADALRRACEAGFDWLAFLDVDEYAWGGSVGSIDLEDGQLQTMLASVDAGIDLVRLPTVEVVPERLPPGTGPGGSTAFEPWRLVHVQPHSRFRREIEDPRTGEAVVLDGFLGHPRGKTIVRVDADLRAVDAHTWTMSDGTEPIEERRGAHLHLVLADGSHWRKKYRKLDPHERWPNGEAVRFPKSAFVAAARDLTEPEARRYFEASVIPSAEDLTRGLVHDQVIRWPLLRATLAAVGHEPLVAARRATSELLDDHAASVRRDADATSATSRGPVAFIGLDAFDVDVAEPLLTDGRLPVLADLLGRGRSTPTEAPPGLFTGAVWPSIWTGTHAGEHGYHCWQQLVVGTYDFDLHHVMDHGLAVQPFWTTLGDRVGVTVLVDPPHVPLSDGLRGVQILEWGGHDAVTPPVTDPPEILDHVVANYGDHPSWGNCNEHGRDTAGFARFRDLMVAGTEAKADLVVDLVARYRPDLLAMVFGESHCIGHQAWHLHDPEAEAHDLDAVAEIGDPVVDVYQAVDAALGRVVDALPDDTTLFVLASHGMGTHTDPTYLVDDVLLRLEVSRRFGRLRRSYQAAERAVQAARPAVAGKAIAPLSRSLGRRLHRQVFEWIDRVEPSQRRWFQHPNNEPEAGIRLNVVGREPEGLIEPDEVDDDVAWLTDALHELRDDEGNPVVRDVLRSRDLYDGPQLDVLPDLMVRWNRRPAMVETLRSPRIGEVSRPYAGARTGDHHPRGLLVEVGPHTEPGQVDAERIRVERIAERLVAAAGG